MEEHRCVEWFPRPRSIVLPIVETRKWRYWNDK